jgi:hypothetical protein
MSGGAFHKQSEDDAQRELWPFGTNISSFAKKSLVELISSYT